MQRRVDFVFTARRQHAQHTDRQEAAGYTVPHTSIENYQPSWLPSKAEDTPSSLSEQTQKVLHLLREYLLPSSQHGRYSFMHLRIFMVSFIPLTQRLLSHTGELGSLWHWSWRSFLCQKHRSPQSLPLLLVLCTLSCHQQGQGLHVGPGFSVQQFKGNDYLPQGSKQMFSLIQPPKRCSILTASLLAASKPKPPNAGKGELASTVL